MDTPEVAIDNALKERFQGISVAFRTVRGVKVEASKPGFKTRIEEVCASLKLRFKLEEVRLQPIFRAYRDFFWRIGIDPTKIRPASEALVRRVLTGKPFPQVNNVVDAYNLASLETGVAIAAFDLDRVKGGLTLRFARPGELFIGIGMASPLTLKGLEPVIADSEKLVAIYPYRDSESTKVTEHTRNVLLVSCGVPGISFTLIEEAAMKALNYITEYCLASSCKAAY
ncbi:MAG: phenylalanine--tRNA ligase beta subunit-related protein [Candidatus Nezhaarchaeales archaeon]